jgi:hypothetical protein
MGTLADVKKRRAEIQIQLDAIKPEDIQADYALIRMRNLMQAAILLDRVIEIRQGDV